MRGDRYLLPQGEWFWRIQQQQQQQQKKQGVQGLQAFTFLCSNH